MANINASLKLKVESRRDSSHDQFFCLIDSDIMKNHGFKEGSKAELRGKKIAGGILFSSTDDRGKNLIRIHKVQRLNLGVEVGDYVEIKLAKMSNIEGLILLPTKQDLNLTKQIIDVKESLLGKPIALGDIVEFTGNIYQKSSLDDTSELLSMIASRQRVKTIPGKLKLVVQRVIPIGIISKVSRKTNVIISKKMAYLNSLGKRISFDDIGGLNDEIQKLRDRINFLFNNLENLKALNMELPKGIMLYGPPGTGKTLLGKALSGEIDSHFIFVNIPDILGRYLGSSEKKLHEIFQKAKKYAPTIIFLNKVDIISPKEEKITHSYIRATLGKLISLLDDIQARNDIVVIAETNKLDIIEPTLRRPGRFDFELEIGIPNYEGRHEILLIHTRSKPLHENVDLPSLAEMTEGFTGADLEFLVKEAVIDAINKSSKTLDNKELNNPILKMDNFLEALKTVKPSSMRN